VKNRIAAAAKAAGQEVDRNNAGEVLGVAAVLALLALAEVDDLVSVSAVSTDRIEAALRRAQANTDKTRAGLGITAPSTRDQDRALAVAAVAAAVAGSTAQSVFKPPTPSGESSLDGSDIVPIARLRAAIDRAGGGEAARTAEDAWEMIGNGKHTADSLARAGFVSDQFRWVYGTSPRQTFEPHLNLDGAVFDRWDSETLSQDGTGGEWVGGSHYYPGDHRGCKCSYERVIVDRSVSLAASAG
jgi:hypothetical protein